MSTTWFWFIMTVASLFLAIVAASYAEYFNNRNKHAPKLLCVFATVLLVVLIVTSFGLSLYNRNNHRRVSLQTELLQRGFVNVKITSVYETSDAVVALPGSKNCSLKLYKDGMWIFNYGNGLRSVTTAEDMTNWSSVKTWCNQNFKWPRKAWPYSRSQPRRHCFARNLMSGLLHFCF